MVRWRQELVQAVRVQFVVGDVLMVVVMISANGSERGEAETIDLCPIIIILVSYWSRVST